jgi:hypothetical protein
MSGIRLAVRSAVSLRLPDLAHCAAQAVDLFHCWGTTPLRDFRMSVHNRTYARPEAGYSHTVIRWNAWRHGPLRIEKE